MTRSQSELWNKMKFSLPIFKIPLEADEPRRVDELSVNKLKLQREQRLMNSLSEVVRGLPSNKN